MEHQLRIKSERVQLGMSQEKLSECLNVSRETISNWEQGNTVIPSSFVVKMAKEIFHCTADWLLGLSDKRTA